MTAKYTFSIIIAVYNCEPFLQETLNSLVNQTFDFSKVEVILVDDGSTDTSAEICEKFQTLHPNNIIVIHKPNGGVSSARNAGVQIARGRYINFLDADDRLSKTALSDVFAFFQKHEDEVDIATIPMRFFDAERGEHWLNGKFNAGTRVIDLQKEPYHCVLSVSSSFYPSRMKTELHFNEAQRLAEDAIVNARILCRNSRLGVVSSCAYEYRRRTAGTSSAIQTAPQEKWYYLDYMRYFIVEAVTYAQSLYGTVPMHIQFMLACDLHWRIRDAKSLENVLETEEQNEYIQLLHWAFHQIEDQVLIAIPNLDSMLLFELLYFKHGSAVLHTIQNDAEVQVNGLQVGLLSEADVQLDVVTLKKNILEIDGTIWRYGIETKNQPVWITIHMNEATKKIPCLLYDRPDLEKKHYGILFRHASGFRVEINLADFSGSYSLVICSETDCGTLIQKRKLKAGFYSAIGTAWPAQYLCKDKRILNICNGAIYVMSATVRKHVFHELRLMKQLLFSKKAANKKAVVVRSLYWIVRRFKRKPIWLISDKRNQADDNGEAFFRFLCAQQPADIDFFFALDRDAEAFIELNKIGKVLIPDSYRYKLMYLLCDCLISSQADKQSTSPFYDYWQPYQDLLSEANTIFLQHGIIKDDLSSWLRHCRQNLSGFVTSTVNEYKSILEGNYGYSSKEVWLTGLPRFDRLYCEKQKKITIMPTWRRYIVEPDHENGGWKAKIDFRESSYFRFYSALLNHSQLLEAAEKYGYQIHFKPHPNIARYAHDFTDDERVVIDEHTISYRQVYAVSSLVVTDYSSAVMDFAYLHKPVIYCHFDADEFFSGKHMYVRGYFDYERDGFGEVEYTLEGVVERIKEYMESDCKIKEEYLERIEHFFAFHDKSNSQRVYNSIIELDKR